MANSALPRRIATVLVHRPFVSIGILLLLLAVSGVGLARLRIESGVSPFIDPRLVGKADLDRINAQFGNDALVLVAFAPAEGVFSQKGLEALRQLGDKLRGIRVGERAPIAEVTSLCTVKDLVGGDLDFKAVPLVGEPVPSDPAALAHIEARTRGNPLIADDLLADDARSSLVAVRLENGLDDETSSAAVEAIRHQVAAATQEGHARAFVAGGPVVDADTARFMAEDLSVFIPANYGLVTLLLWVFLRRVWGVLLVLANVTLCLLVSLGVLALTGGTINNLSTILPPLAMVLGVAALIHFLAEFSHHARHGEPATAGVDTIEGLLVPQSMCAITTAIGFASLSVSDVPAMREFGVAAAIAVMLFLLVSFPLAGLASRFAQPDRLISLRSTGSKRVEGWLIRYADLVIRRPWGLLVASAALFVATTVGMTRIVVDMDAIGSFDRGTPVREAAEYLEAHFGGTTTLLVSIEADHPGAFYEPQTLARLEKLEERLRSEAAAQRVTSALGYLKLMNRAFLGEAPAEFRVPATANQVSQLVLINSDDRFGDSLDAEGRWARVVARTPVRSDARVGELYRRIDAATAELFPAASGFRVHAVSDGRLWATITDSIVGSQVSSFGLSFILIFGPIILLFRSFIAGVWAIPSNVYPIGITLGVMGWAGIPLDTATAMIASITLGIAVDDTLHFLQHLREGIAQSGDPFKALKQTLIVKGVGVTWTSLVLCLGLSVFAASHFAPTQHFGLLTCLAILTGAIGELFLLPPLLVLTKSRVGVPVSESQSSTVLTAGPSGIDGTK